MTKFVLALTALLSAAACNSSTEGAFGNVAFTPLECGRVLCTLDESVGVGGTINLRIAGLKGMTTVAATVSSEEVDLVSVFPVADQDQPTWEIEALGPGTAIINVHGVDSQLMDFVELSIREPAYLSAKNILGDAVGPSDNPNYDEVWIVNADQEVSFQMTAINSDDQPLMGKFSFDATLDIGLENGLLDTDLGRGYLHFNVPAGDYLATFKEVHGREIRMLIVSQ